ncbi:ribosome-inactivating family protein [Paenibacillus glycinis]|uniref:Uncharacterized protein n=1 Tax=Paenibacillus glycinis TaxID=2697035 RepID=A0ABW9XK59_9BACL|nr:ribosome-inactivating family protein [Paenibacillus glycinis]NBD22996.1 hypothetical protein [Paenibacillus glycinis]
MPTIYRKIGIWFSVALLLWPLLSVWKPSVANAQAGDKRIIKWDVSGLNGDSNWQRETNAARYASVIQQIRNAALGRTLQNGVQLTTTTHRIIEVQIYNGYNVAGFPNYLVTVYLWADTLYAFGYWTPQGDYYFYNDQTLAYHARNDLGLTANQVTYLPWNGNYATMPEGSPEARAANEYTNDQLWNTVWNLSDMHDYLNRNAQSRNTVGHNMVRIIGALAEAARFQVIRNVIYNNLLYGTNAPIGETPAAIENNWATITDWAIQQANGNYYGITINDHYYSTLAAFLAVAYYVLGRNPCGGGGGGGSCG